MKKLIIFILSTIFISGLFAQQIEIPKNYDILEINHSIRYCDDNVENTYKLYSVVYKTDLINMTELHSIKTSLTSNIDVSITVKFDTEEELDDFIDFFYYSYNYKVKNSPYFFDELKDFIIDLGVEPIYVMDDNNSPKHIIYTAKLTQN